MTKELCNKRNLNRIIYTLCFFLFVVIDQRVKTLPSREGWLATWQNILGLVVGILILTHYKRSDFKRCKIAYVMWSIIGIAWGIGYYMLRSMQEVFFANAIIVLIADILLFGYIMIHTYFDIVVDKNIPQIKKSFFIVWLIMMLLMVFSRSEFRWPIAYLFVFGLFYLTDFSKEEITDMVIFGCSGISLSFLIIQGLAFVFRPYDTSRYCGNYTNSNQNAFFYVMVLAAIIVLMINSKKKDYKLFCGIYILGICVVLDFIFMAQGRMAIIVTIVLILFLLKIMSIDKKRSVIKSAGIFLAGAIIMFPMCFASVRYIPPLFHHPIWYDGEWAEYRVHSWDSWDSPKYTNYDEFMDVVFGRIGETFSSVFHNSPFKIDADASDVSEQNVQPEFLLTDEEGKDSMLIRKTIYKYYFDNLSWFGQPYREQGVWLTKTYFAYHAHNLYLQYGTDFGIPVMILLIVLVVWSCLIYGKRIYKESNIEDIAMLMFILVPAVYGILEYSWGVGSIGTTMLFIAWRIPEWKN